MANISKWQIFPIYGEKYSQNLVLNYGSIRKREKIFMKQASGLKIKLYNTFFSSLSCLESVLQRNPFDCSQFS